jgi:hypothetical protein
MKKLLVIVLSIAAAWIGGRFVIHHGDVRATIVMRDAGALRAGDPVVENSTVAGKVTKISALDGEVAVSIRVDRDHRRSVVSDSLFSVDGHRLLVNNTVALGTPIDDGALLRARDGGFAQWLARHGDPLAPLLAKAKSATDAKVDDADRKIAEARASVAKMEEELKKSNRLDEAKALRERFDRWVSSHAERSEASTKAPR